jgi:hypothetical protein
MDQVAAIQKKTVFTVDQIPGNLLHPQPVWRNADPSDLNPTRLEMDHEEHEVPNEPAPCQDLDREEVRRSDRTPMGPQERLPSYRTTPGWIDSVLDNYALDRVSADAIPEVHELAANARVSPAGVLKGHPNDQLLDFAIDSGTSGPPPRASVVLRRDQLAIPAEQHIGCDDGGDLSKSSASKTLRFPSEPASLRVGESQTLPAEVLAENAVLLLQKLDHFLLVSAQPSSK